MKYLSLVNKDSMDCQLQHDDFHHNIPGVYWVQEYISLDCSVSMQTSMNQIRTFLWVLYSGTVVYLQYSKHACCIYLHGERVSQIGSLPTCGTTFAYLEVWDLLIIQSVCAGHLYFVYVISILCIIILWWITSHGALVTFFLPLFFLPVPPFSRLQFMSLIIGLIKATLTFYKTSLWDNLYKLDPFSPLF